MKSPFSRTGGAAAGAVLAALLLLAGPARAFDPVYVESGLAIGGYDPVAYFVRGAATEGSAEFEAQHAGATWRFASAENREMFLADPGKYAPQYGGYCAYAVSEGYTAEIDPDAWSIVDGRLFLNYSTGIRSRWEKNNAERVAAGDRNWPRIVENGGKL